MASSLGFTDHHFQSILKNPLFTSGMKDQYESVPSSYSTHQGDASHNPTPSFDPMALFEASVASGSATIGTATYAMDTLQKILTSSPETSIKQGMATSLAGSKIHRWLRSSGLEDSLRPSEDGKFIALLTNYLLAENRHDVIFNWFYKLQAESRRCLLEKSTGYQSGPIHLAQRLLLRLVKGELNLGNGLKAAVDNFLRVVNNETVAGFKELQSTGKEEHSHLSYLLLGPTGNYLVYKLTREGGAGQLDPDSIECFTRNIKMWAPDEEFFRAAIHLHHPVKSSAVAALAYLKRKARMRTQMESPKKRRAIVHLSLDCASLLLQQDRYSEATWVMDFTRRGYAAELGIVKGSQTDEVVVKDVLDRIPSAYDEISNLELLASLDTR